MSIATESDFSRLLPLKIWSTTQPSIHKHRVKLDPQLAFHARAPILTNADRDTLAETNVYRQEPDATSTSFTMPKQRTGTNATSTNSFTLSKRDTSVLINRTTPSACEVMSMIHVWLVM
ncbi:hypothetical protein LTR10_004704 [Elasticomyces elasticus]|nr:hypothetical protein LTR10_004704 [Elasticomyces elasticus]KAK4977022.1 hypothetical protein LTR42_003068 [Elasticomyces elasticus]